MAAQHEPRPAGVDLDACAAVARATADTFAAAAETYLGSTGPAGHVEQHVTGRDGTRYVITFHRGDSPGPGELLNTTRATLDRLITAIGHLADQLDIRGHDTRILSVRGMLREISASLRNLLPSDAGQPEAGVRAPHNGAGRPGGPAALT